MSSSWLQHYVLHLPCMCYQLVGSTIRGGQLDLSSIMTSINVFALISRAPTTSIHEPLASQAFDLPTTFDFLILLVLQF